MQTACHAKRREFNVYKLSLPVWQLVPLKARSTILLLVTTRARSSQAQIRAMGTTQSSGPSAPEWKRNVVRNPQEAIKVRLGCRTSRTVSFRYLRCRRQTINARSYCSLQAKQELSLS
jgi:hypothetical protein